MPGIKSPAYPVIEFFLLKPVQLVHKPSKTMGPSRTGDLQFCTTESTHHFNTIADLLIGIGFFRDQRDFKKIVGKGRRLDLPLQSGSPPRIRSGDLPVLQ